MKIAIFGTGYVGIVTAVGLADKGKDIICIDNDKSKIKKIKEGISPVFEPGLDELLARNIGQIEATTLAKEAVIEADVIIIAVGTPFDGRYIDLTYIKQAAREIGEAMKESPNFKVIVVKSTVIPGTTMDVVKPLVLEHSGRKEEEVGFAMNPEFLREGNAIEDFTDPDRIVLGVTSKRVEEVLLEVYSGYSDADILITSPSTAEMIKYTANAYLALNISYANEIARICERLPDVDSEEVFHGVILDKRFSPIIDENRIIPQLASYLKAGIGFGGSCFPKDVSALEAFSEDLDIDGKLLSGLLHINKTQLEHVFRFGLDKINGKTNRITILGTAFKPGTDDIRESPGIKLGQMALDNGINVAVHDFIALENTKSHFMDKVEYYEDPLEAIAGSDLIFITTAWPEYKEISDTEYQNNLNENAIVIDTRSHFKDREKKPWRHRIGVGI